MKALWKISVTTMLEAEDAVAELLGTILGQPASSHFNVETHASVVSVYFSEKRFLSREVREEISAGLKRIENCGLKIGAGKIKCAKVRREDWAESWKQHFKPIEIKCDAGARTVRPRDRAAIVKTRGRAVRAPVESLLVKPSWSKRRARKNQAVVILDPGLSFGTGQHATTSFCLHQIVAAVCDRRDQHSQIAATKSFLDIGTGSGILAIAAATLGYQPIHAFDFDPEAVRVARANTRVNQIGEKLKITRDDVTKLPVHAKQKYDLVCANLISNLLVAERKKIVAQLNRGGILVLAGILKSEFKQVQTVFEDLGMKLIASKSEKEWRSGSFRFATK